MTDWSDTPPTEPGYYWLRHRHGLSDSIGGFSCHNWTIGASFVSPSRAAEYFQFGSRIPSNAELLAMHKQIATLTEQRRAHCLEMHEVDVTLGKALGYPAIYVDPATNAVVSDDFPGAVKTDDVCTGDHITATLAIEAARKIAELKATCIAYETDEHGMRHTLGAAIGYPQDEHGEVCVGNTTAARLADEAARKIAALTAERDAAEAELEAATQRILDQEVA